MMCDEKLELDIGSYHENEKQYGRNKWVARSELK